MHSGIRRGGSYVPIHATGRLLLRSALHEVHNDKSVGGEGVHNRTELGRRDVDGGLLDALQRDNKAAFALRRGSRVQQGTKLSRLSEVLSDRRRCESRSFTNTGSCNWPCSSTSAVYKVGNTVVQVFLYEH